MVHPTAMVCKKATPEGQTIHQVGGSNAYRVITTLDREPYPAREPSGRCGRDSK